ncbi:MAG: hypothetical protein ACK5PS_00450 [Desulfopila sp.]
MGPTTATPGTRPPPCPGCGGSGQTAFFRGVSRFVMELDDCPDCAGTGLWQPAAESDTAPHQEQGEKPSPPERKQP